MTLLEYVAPSTGGVPDEAFPPSWGEEDREKARDYLPSNELIDAANVALLLNQPLLLTGEPGTGKTLFGYYVSWKLRRDPPLLFETKSTSAARDLFYTYDTLGRFHTAQVQKEQKDEQGNTLPMKPAREFVTYNALGIAILRANAKEAVKEWLPENSDVFEFGEKLQSVVVIDEVDKAPRDFPNDILNEIEHLYFKIPELGVTGSKKIEAPADMRPLLVMTSNSEKHLPDAFLRRCVYHNISFPDTITLERIVLARMGKFRGVEKWLKDALTLFSEVRKLDARLDKKPATAELLSWLKALHQMLEIKGSPAPVREQKQIVLSTFKATLLKSEKDQKLSQPVIDKWLG